MKDKIILFIIGVLVGAVISISAIFVYTKANNSCGCRKQNIQMNQPQQMPSGQNNENGQPPEKPNDGNMQNNSNTEQNNN